MEKLQPLLTHKYWVVFGLALILPTVGWWIDTAGVNAETEAAIQANETAFTNVPPHDSPNAGWSTEMRAKVNVVLEGDYKKHNRYLWETQRKERVWPESINAYMQDIPFESEIAPYIRRSYRKEYFKELDAAWKVVDPLTDELTDGKVVFDIVNFIPQVAPGDWPENPPDSKEMWEIQQDIWLLKALLSAIENVNHNFNNHLQAPINTILAVELRGGNTAALMSRSTGRSGARGGPASDTRMGMAAGRNGEDGSARGAGGIDVDLDKLFGPDALTGTEGMRGENRSAPSQRGASFSASSRRGDSRGQGGGRRRYVDDEEGAPFKTRAFYLKVIMDHGRLPDLLIQLSNLEWPVEIVLVQQQIVNPDNLQVVQGRTGRQSRGGARGGMRSTRRRARPMASQGRGRTGARSTRGRSSDRTAGLGRETREGGNSRSARNSLRPGFPGTDLNQIIDIEGMIQAAGLKTNLAMVSIAGKLTLFQPPPEEDEALAAVGTVENGKPTTPETTDDADMNAADSPEAAENAADKPMESLGVTR